MKLTIERAALLTALSHVQSVVERRNTIPILSNVQIEANRQGISLTATDLDLAVVERVPAKVAQEGTTTVPAHTFYEIVRKLPEGAEIQCVYPSSEQRLSLSAGRSEFSLACLPKEDFPVMTAGDFSHHFSLPAAELRRLIDKTKFAISTEETRYYLNGIYLHVGESGGIKVLRGVATDGHRLARVEMPLPDGAAGMPGAIVPRKTIMELRKLVDSTEEDARVSLSETRVRFAVGHALLTSKLIDGTFPDYERVIPTGNDKRMEVEGKVFAAAVDRVSTIATEKGRAVKLVLDRDRLVLSAMSPESGTASEEVPVSYSDGPLEIGFNSRYLMDITTQIEGESAHFAMNDAASPTVVRDGTDDSALYVLMPMRV